jgi:hypothetical protein
VRQENRSVLRDRGIAGTRLRRYLRNHCELALRVGAGDGQLRIARGAYIQKVRGRDVANVIYAVAGVHLGKYGSVMSDIEHLREGAAGHEQVARVRVQP